MLRTTGHGCLWLFLLIITIQVLPVPRSAGNVASKEVWQSSQEPVVEVGVRNKNGNRDKYTAVWIVSEPDGVRRGSTATVERDNWGYVLYPDDFRIYAKPGRYSWECLVDGRQVAAGFFVYKSVAGYSDQLEAPW